MTKNTYINIVPFFIIIIFIYSTFYIHLSTIYQVSL